jgi:hypothetical protein
MHRVDGTAGTTVQVRCQYNTCQIRARQDQGHRVVVYVDDRRIFVRPEPSSESLHHWCRCPWCRYSPHDIDTVRFCITCKRENTGRCCRRVAICQQVQFALDKSRHLRQAKLDSSWRKLPTSFWSTSLSATLSRTSKPKPG